MTMQQAYDFRDESDALAAVLDGRPESDWNRPTLFKDWTANDVLRHLHFWNRGADLALTDPDGFRDCVRRFREKADAVGRGAAEATMVGGLGGPALLDDWRGFYREMAERWAAVDPRRRVPWVGPDMSARSSITARLMETWSHGQAIFDLFGVERVEHDRIRNVVVLGVNTYGWTWAVREREGPGADAAPPTHRPVRRSLGIRRGRRGEPHRGTGRRLRPGRRPDPERRGHGPSRGRAGGDGMDGERPVLRRPARDPAPARRPPHRG